MSWSRTTASPASRTRHLRGTLVLAALSLVAASLAAPVAAQDPPLPDFLKMYGNVQLDGANLSPEVQPVIAFAKGNACGEGATLLAPPGPDTPGEDAGKTVYALNVLADGSGPGQRPGCGRPGDSVSFYFPLAGRLARETATFHQGEQRLNLTLGAPLATRLLLHFVSDDGPLE